MKVDAAVYPPGFLAKPTRFLFFTGNGGVGKTSIACSAAIALADSGKSVLLVSTDPASNLDEILDVPLRNLPVAVPGIDNLHVLNIDPTVAAESYRLRVLAQLGPDASDQDRKKIREQLSGACTTEIAAFDEFVGHLAGTDEIYDHTIFDTAPTGHTLRLLSLPQAWSSFLAGDDQGASCLGPTSGLKTQEARFREAMVTLCDPASTTVILVTRPEIGAITEAARTSTELSALGLLNQRLVVNGVFSATDRSDATAMSLEDQGNRALSDLPAALRRLARDDVRLQPFEMLGVGALRSLLGPDVAINTQARPALAVHFGSRERMADISTEGRRLYASVDAASSGRMFICSAPRRGSIRYFGERSTVRSSLGPCSSPTNSLRPSRRRWDTPARKCHPTRCTDHRILDFSLIISPSTANLPYP